MLSIDERLLVIRAGQRPATVFALEFAQRAVRASRLQLERIYRWEERSASLEEVIAINEDRLTDIHFFFIAIRNIYRYLRKVVQDDSFAELGPRLEQLNGQWFKAYSAAREAFEHIDQRLPGETHANRIVAIDGGRRAVHYGFSPRTGVFRHSDQEWDIGQQNIGRFHDDVASFIAAVFDLARRGTSGKAS